MKTTFNSRYRTISEIIQSDSMTCLEETNGQNALIGWLVVLGLTAL